MVFVIDTHGIESAIADGIRKLGVPVRTETEFPKLGSGAVLPSVVVVVGGQEFHAEVGKVIERRLGDKCEYAVEYAGEYDVKTTVDAVRRHVGLVDGEIWAPL